MITLKCRPITKKNSQQFYRNKKTGRRIIAQSDVYQGLRDSLLVADPGGTRGCRPGEALYDGEILDAVPSIVARSFWVAAGHGRYSAERRSHWERPGYRAAGRQRDCGSRYGESEGGGHAGAILFDFGRSSVSEEITSGHFVQKLSRSISPKWASCFYVLLPKMATLNL